eukprot:Protomagalhaensia_wolfi_Nauph_80__20@NODE_1013_length_1810_cov_374_998306_g766_i0_p1_GENE_NODE_1013_length_1810_cov_374_998306_g766_i0NODE_1013_length_1810_cov_374_998306_g766_i0_p1_ORF_typecomplete_len305_score51_63_NODE_1013_length_1810_cov_374_998306_g766_i08151729
MRGFEQEILGWIKETEFSYDLMRAAREKFLQEANLDPEEKLINLRSASNLALMTGLPVLPRGKIAKSTLPYWLEWGHPDFSGLLYRIDTFHPQWELIRVALYKGVWLAIFPLDPKTVDIWEAQNNPFWLRGGQPAEPFKPSPWPMEGIDVETPPENMIPLKEVTVTLFDNTEALSPIGRLMQNAKKPALEIIRYCNNVPTTYWLLGANNQAVVQRWHSILDEGTRNNDPPMTDMPVDSSLYTPSTNPKVKPGEIGIEFPPHGNRWAAFHVAAVAAAESAARHKMDNPEETPEISKVFLHPNRPV